MRRRIDIHVREDSTGIVETEIVSGGRSLGSVPFDPSLAFHGSDSGVLEHLPHHRAIEALQIRRIPDEARTTEDLGLRLFENVFAGDRAGSFRELRHAASGAGDSIDLCIVHHDGAGEHVHWELLRDPVSGDPRFLGFLALSDDVTLFHEYPDAGGEVAVAAGDAPLSVLFLGVSPKDEITANVDQEWKCLGDACQQAAFQGFHVPVHPQKPQRITRDLLTRLRRGERPFDPTPDVPASRNVIHVAGHGEVDPITGRIDFVVEGPDGLADRIPGALLAEAVCHAEPVALAILNSCWGLGIALDFLRAGASQVIGNRTRATDRGAVEFSQAFYGDVFLGHSVEQALLHARRRVWEVGRATGGRSRAGNPASPWDWANPVWMRGSNPWMPAPARTPPGTGQGGNPDEAATRRPRRHRAWIRVVAAGLAAVAVIALSLWPAPRLHAPRDPAPARAMVPPDSWPQHPILLVLPFDGAPQNAIHRELWPLMDRFLFNALDPEERYLGRLDRVDPRSVSAFLEPRGMHPPFGDADVRALAREFGANVVFQGILAVDGATQGVNGTLRLVGGEASPPDGGLKGIEVSATGLRPTDLARTLARTITGRLFDPEGDAPLPEERRASLLLGAGPGDEILELRSPDSSSVSRIRAYQGRLEKDPTAVGFGWMLFLETVEANKDSPALASLAERTRDPELATFFREVSRRTTTCANVDADSLARRYPWLIGNLARATCLFRQGRMQEALDATLEAVRNPRLRPLAAPFLVLRQLPSSCASAAALREEILALLPEDAVGWSALATWLADCGEPGRAREKLAIARSLLGTEGYPRYRVAFHALTIDLILADRKAADADAQELRRLHEERLAGSENPDARFYSLMASYQGQRGRFRESLETQAAGLQALAKHAGSRPDENGFTQLASSYVYGCLQQARALPGEREQWITKADQALATFSSLFPSTSADSQEDDPSNLYILQSLQAVVRWDRTAHANPRAIWEETHRISQSFGDRLAGRGHRSELLIQQGHLATLLGDVERCVALLRESPTNRFLSGCRILVGGRYLEENRTGEAIDAFETALRNLFVPSFVFSYSLPEGLKGLAEAYEKARRPEDALATWRRLAAAYDQADLDLPEHSAAHNAVLRLEALGFGNSN